MNGDASPSDRVVDWTEVTLTSRCNQRCFFCYEDARANSTDPDLEQVKALLRQTREHAEQVTLCGREVLLRRDVTEIVRYGTALGLRVAVFTNAQRLARPGLVAELAEAGCAGLAVSFHFPDRDSFARGARVSPKAFDWILQGLQNVRDYALAHPDAPLSISTETDMFALNMGRLAEMRQTLMGVLHGAPWKMRLASLLPTRTYDIGLERIADSLAERRAEVAEFVRTQPPDVPLGFVKVPLCLLPLEVVHRSLDVQYVYEGTLLTFNHLDAGRIEVDEFSPSLRRDLAHMLHRYPYRWVCRTCQLAPLCRFERVDWTEAGFAPTHADRPLPVRPAPVPAWDAPEDAPPPEPEPGTLPIPWQDGAVASILARLGPERTPARRVEDCCRQLAEEPFPEEAILGALALPEAGAPALVDVWCEGAPFAAIALQTGGGEGEGASAGERVRLHLGVASEADEGTERALSALVGYLDVRPLDPAPSPAALRACLERLARLPLPDPSGWADAWFNARVAGVLQAVSAQVGPVAWPGLGALAGWRTARVALRRSLEVYVALDHPDGARARLQWPPEGDGGGRTTLTLEDARSAPSAAVAELLAAAGALLSGGGPVSAVPPADLAPDPDGGLRALFDGDRWLRVRPAPPVAAGGEALLVTIRSPLLPQEYGFQIARNDPSRPVFRRLGGLMVWHTHATHDRPSEACLRVLLVAMKQLQAEAPSEASLPVWRRTIDELARRAHLSDRVEWELRLVGA
jgi:organic radical activating enzyme